MSKQSTFTVGIPVYNGARYLEPALKSILAQKADSEPFDLLICDDRSDDSSLEITRNLVGDQARIEVSTERLGLAGNWNRCVKLSTTEWVTVFHQDDVMKPGHLAAHGRLAGKHRDAGMITGPAQAIDEQGKPVSATIVAPDHLGQTFRRFEPGQFLPELAVENPVRCSAVSLKRTSHQKLGGFDAKLHYALDWEFWIRLAKKYPVIWSGEPTVDFRWHSASETHSFKTGTQDLDEQMVVVVKLLLTADFDPVESNKLARAADLRLANAYLNRAYEASKVGNRSLMLKCLKCIARDQPRTLLRCITEPRLGARLLWGLVRGSST